MTQRRWWRIIESHYQVGLELRLIIIWTVSHRTRALSRRDKERYVRNFTADTESFLTKKKKKIQPLTEP